MSSLLVQNALDNVWSVPDPFNQVILKPGRITPINGVSKYFDYAWDTFYLPNQTSIFHLYQIGQVGPVLIDLFEADSQWRLLSDACNNTFIVADIYTEFGLQLPRTRTWYFVTENKNIIVAVEKNSKLKYDFNDDAVYVRFYKNAYFEQDNIGPSDMIAVGGGIMTSSADIIALTTQVNAIVTSPNYHGGIYYFVNGYKQPALNAVTVNVGDVAEFVYDTTIYKVADFRISDCASFYSELDNLNKILLHYAGNNDGFIDYIDNIDIFMIDSSTQKGVYVHKNAKEALRMVTYKDYSFVTNYLYPYFPNFYVNGVVHVPNLYLRLHIRYSGNPDTPTLEANQVSYLMKLSDAQLTQAMSGVNSTMPAWRASALEKSAYCQLMRSSYNQITENLVEQAYGYTKCNYAMGENLKTVPASGTFAVAVQAAFQNGATAYEYDSAGLLLGFYSVTPLSLWYSPTNSNAALVEFIEGIGSDVLDEKYELVTTLIDPSKNYRYYVLVPNAQTNQNNWVDVTDQSYYLVTSGVSTWDNTSPIGVVKRLVRSDKNFLAYQTTVNSVDGVLAHSITYKQNTLSGQISTTMQIPLGDLDVWLNGHSLVEGIDYVFNFPVVNIFAKEYLNPTPSAQTLTIRFTGHCSAQLEPRKPKDVGYVFDGVLSANGRYNLHKERIQRIVVGGKLMNPSAVRYVEDQPSGSLVDGKPYSIKDVISPLGGILKQDPYRFYDSSMIVENAASDYLTRLLPQTTASPINPIVNKYRLYSPFLGKILSDLNSGYLSDPMMDDPYPDSFVTDLCARYQYLLKNDPIAPQNVPDLRYCVIHPHWLDVPISLNANNYRFFLNVVRIYAQGVVAISSMVTLAAGQ